MTTYYRPIVMTDPARPEGALTLAGGWCWFDRLEVLERGTVPRVISVNDAPPEAIAPLIAPRAAIAGLSMNRIRIMGILNATPDSFSDGGKFAQADVAISAGVEMITDGADIVDIGGESTRPGAQEVPVAEEIARVEPIVAALADKTVVSIDTRKSEVAAAAIQAGAHFINDVSALQFDPALGALTAQNELPICLMHAQGAPENMQDNPQYEDVVLDVYDGLKQSIERAKAAGIKTEAIVADPGIGFGKTLEHNVKLLKRISLFHSLGVPILLGASRKRFIGTLTQQSDAQQRLAGSLSVASHAHGQGIQMIRVHDIRETREALQMAVALSEQE